MSKKALQDLIRSIKDKKYREGEGKQILGNIEDQLVEKFGPIMERVSQSTSESANKALAEALSNIKLPETKFPEIPAPIVNIPESQQPIIRPVVNVPAPIVNVPAPIVNIPATVFPERFRVEMDTVGPKTPLAVVMYDVKGQPMQFSFQGSGGGKTDHFTIKGFGQSAFSEITNPDGRIKVELPTGSSGLTDTELRATAVPVSQVSDASWSVAVKEIFGSTVTSLFNGDNRIPVSVETGGSGLTDSELRATAVPVAQVSGSAWSVSVNDVFGTIGTDVVNPDGRVKVELPTGSSGLTDTELRATAVPVSQVSGSAWSVSVTDVFGSIGANVINPDNRIKVELPTGSSGLTDTELRASHLDVDQVSGSMWSMVVTGFTASVGASLIDSTGIGYSGSNPVPVTIAVSNATATVNATLVDSTGAYRGTLPVAVVAGSAAIGSVTVNGSLNSVIAVGATLHGVADPGAAPQKVGGVVMTANPTAEVGGDITNFRADDIGRQLVRNIQVRDLIRTAYVSVTNGTETTLRAAVAGAFLDLIMIVGSNNSDAAVSVDIRPVTAGNIINTLMIPANGTAGWTPPVPWPQSEQGNNWTIDGPDETGRTLTFSALFSQEI